MQRDSFLGTLVVATVLCVVCSVLVATAAVGLRSRQEANKQLDQKKNVLLAASLYDEETNTADDIETIFADRIERELIDLETGDTVSEEEVDPESFDQRKAAKDPELNEPVEPPTALGGVKQRSKYAFVYKVKSEAGGVEQVVLPIHGNGLWSTLYGFLSVAADGHTVRGITFYEHGETPGLGGEVDNPKWKSLWDGKKLYLGEEIGEVELKVIKGSVDKESPEAEYQVDGLSGATLTSVGVSKTIQYWLGPEGFAPYLRQITGQEGEAEGG